jgi:hypothetical protein
VPLLALPTNQTAVAGTLGGSSKSVVDDANLVYADPSKITYSTIQPGSTIAGPAGPDVQVNDPSLDNIQSVTTWKWPFEFANSWETTVAADGADIVVGYIRINSRIVKWAGNNNAGPGLWAYLLASSYSVSHDGGQTWRSAFLTPAPGSIVTLGDPVLATDRAGNFYYASLGKDSNLNKCVLVGKSTDHGETFAPAQVVALDPGADKPWIAIGPDPNVPSRDNIYVTWSSLNFPTSSTLAFAMSTDGGQTWSPRRTLFAYTDDGVLSSFVFNYSNPRVDNSNGRFYVPFVQGSDIGRDFLRLLVSDDGGNTFTPQAFTAPGTPNPLVYPLAKPGILADCGQEGGIRLVLKQGPNIGGGLWTELYGLPRYVQSARLGDPFGSPQSSAAVQNGRLVLVSANSTLTTEGDPASQSQIVALYSKNGGSTWFPPFVVAPATANDPQHCCPAAALTANGSTLYVAYYVQDSTEKFRTELATLQVAGNGLQLLSRRPLSSVTFDLSPSNIPSPLSPLKSEDTTDVETMKVPGDSLGDYLGLTIDANGNPMAAWTDSRNTWVSPANGFFPGPHPKADVFFVRLGSQ